jgi:hypothetical protein
MTKETKNAFALRVAILSAFGYGITVTATTFVDARIPSHVRFGARDYPYGYASALLALPILMVTFLTLRRDISRGWKCFFSCVPLATVVVGSLWLFMPEFPHAGILGWSFVYLVVALLTTWFRCYDPELSFARDNEIPMQARIEGLKTMASVWQTITIATCAGFLAGLIPWAASIFSANSQVVSSRRDLFFLNSTGLIQMSLCGFAFLLGPIREVVLRVLSITEEFRSIKGDCRTGAAGNADTAEFANRQSQETRSVGRQRKRP